MKTFKEILDWDKYLNYLIERKEEEEDKDAQDSFMSDINTYISIQYPEIDLEKFIEFISSYDFDDSI